MNSDPKKPGKKRGIPPTPHNPTPPEAPPSDPRPREPDPTGPFPDQQPEKTV